MIAVEDNGRGFEPTTGTPGSDGLRNMRARIESIGGNLELTSDAAGGTKLRVQVPVSK
jgi:two-component system NarL family sensor kinase